jgi:hypothetical protein
MSRLRKPMDTDKFRWCGPDEPECGPECPRCDYTCESRPYKHAHESRKYQSYIPQKGKP